MFAPLLSTKFYIPRQPLSQRATFVARPQLLAQLAAGLSGKLTLIAAPAGFGKSSLLSNWIDEPEGIQMPSSSLAAPTTTEPASSVRPTFCWLSLEASDNDPIRFWLYFIAALHSKNPDLAADLPALLQSPEPPPLETILTLLLNKLSAWPSEIEPAIVLVLDDYHLITAPAIHQSLSFLLEHLPPALHLIMTTRADPPLPLARLRAHGQLSEIRADALRFTDPETALFLNERMGLQLSSTEVELLTARTEGWIVGLQLAALSMHGHDDKADFLRSFSGGHRYILNYLIEEVLNQQPKAIQEFLLHTSILARLCGTLCDAVMGTDAVMRTQDSDATVAFSSPLPRNSQAMLAQLEQANLFLVPLDDREEWYRYHQLFAEVLQHRLQQSEPLLLPTLHHRASLWYAQEGYLAEAIQHALLAVDFPYAAALIEEAWPTLWDQGAIATLFNWMQALPPTDLSDRPLWGRPSLYIFYAWGLALTGQIEAAEACLQQVTVALQQIAPATATAAHEALLGRAAALRAMLAARRGELATAVSLAEQALALIPSTTRSRGDAYYALGLAKQQQGLLDAAIQAYEVAAKVSTAVNDSFLTNAAHYHEARILMAQGHLQQAATSYQQILTVAAHAKKQLSVVGLSHIGYGEILYQWNQLAAASHQVEAGLALSTRHDLTYTDGPLHRFSILARIRQAMGDRDGALAAVALAKETAQQTGIGLDVERVAALDALIKLRFGELATAERWAAAYVQTRSADERFAYLYEFETLVLVRVLLAQQRSEEALAFLSAWLPVVEPTQRLNSLLELTILQVLALRLVGQLEQATLILARAIALAKQEGYVRLFVDEGEAMQRALTDFSTRRHHAGHEQQQIADQADLQAYSTTLVAAFGNAAAALRPLPQQISPTVTTPVTLSSPSPLALVEPLTERELEVLHLVTAGLSNAAIADQLVVSVGTVKTHLKHIYGKLGVQSRTQAVAQARALALL